MRTRGIFIGSSSEAGDQALKVGQVLSSIEGVEPMLWQNHFKPGEITFLAIERIASEAAGAIFLATPDDDTRFRENDIRTPRANVIFEYGFLAATLGRARVGLCLYDRAVLPTDFSGLTTINMGPFAKNGALADDGIRRLQEFARGLPRLPHKLAATKLLHGVAGVWNIGLIFKKWRGLEIGDGEYADLRGVAHIQVDPDGRQDGSGFINGTLEIQIGGCYVKFAVCDEIEEVTFDADGTLKFTSCTFARQLIDLQGAPPQKEGFEQVLPGGNPFHWVLHPTGEGAFAGDYVSNRSGRPWSIGCVELRRNRIDT